MPLAVYGGRRDVMSLIAPLGSVYQAGTLSGNPIATAAGLATLRFLRKNKDNVYAEIEQKAKKLEDAYRKAGVAVNRVGSLLSPFFTKKSPSGFSDVKQCDLQKFAKYFGRMLGRGNYVAPSQFEAMFVSFAHTDEHIGKTCKDIAEACAELGFDR